jgi:spoIIIJ-associated protein
MRPKKIRNEKMSDQNESLNVNAKTIDEAIEQGLSQLGLARDQVEIEIVSEGKRGLFGLGSEEALVRLTPKTDSAGTDTESEDSPVEAAAVIDRTDPDSSLEQDLPDTAGAGRLAVAEVEAPLPDQEERVEVDEVQDSSVEAIGTAYLTGLLARMGVEAEVSTRIAEDLVERGEEPPLVFDVTGKDLGILIGRRNETLQALQFMLRLMVSKELGSWQPLVVDVESYRARRRQSLRNMAQRMADRAVANQERVVLEAMPAYERRIIHIALRDNPSVTTQSIGHEKNRKVTILPK